MEYVDEIRISVGSNDTNERQSSGSTSDLHNSLLSLLSQSRTSSKAKQETVENDPYYFGEYEKEEPKKKEKKSKKDKKKKKNKGSLLEDLDVDVIYGGDFVKDKYAQSIQELNDDNYDEEEDTNLIDVDKVFEDDDEYDDVGDIIYDQKNAYKKNKKSDNEFRKEFAEELALLYNLLDETNSFGTDLDKIYKAMTSSKTRGFSKYTSDIITSILSTKQTKLSVLKEIASVKKTIADLALKESKNSNADGTNDVSALAASYLGTIIKTGRQNVVNALTNDEDSYYDTDNEAINNFVNNAGDYEDDDERENLTQEILDELDGNRSRKRSQQSDAYIRNEAREVKIQIQKDVATGRWDFIAVDKNGTRVLDYPTPIKSEVSPVSFTTDGTFGTDKFGRSYKVIEIL